DYFFFFQAEDGIRDFHVTGVQTCALPICILASPLTLIYYDSGFLAGLKGFVAAIFGGLMSFPLAVVGALVIAFLETFGAFWASRSEERRVGEVGGCWT